MDDTANEATGPPVASEQDPAGETVINPVTTATEKETAEASKINCPSCGSGYPPTEEFCILCGTELKAAVETQEISNGPTEMTAEQLEEYKLLTLPRTPIKVDSYGITHIGRVEEYGKDAVNEDAVHVPGCINYPLHKIAVHVAIVADGMGFEPGGEVFSQMACYETWLGIRFLLPYFEQQHGFQKLEFWRYINTQLSTYLPAQIASANSRIVRYAKMKQFKVGECGSTIVVVVAVCDLETGRVIFHGWNEGDARAVLIIGEEFKQLSTDHTIIGAPYRFLGKRDQIGGSSFTSEFWLAESQTKTFWVLLYSDGLWNMLSDTQMTAAISSSQDPRSLCDVLVASALTVETPAGKEQDSRVQPGDDNIAIAAIRCTTVEGVTTI